MESIGRIEIAGAAMKSRRRHPMGLFVTVEPLPTGGWRLDLEVGTGPQASTESASPEKTRVVVTGGPDEPSPLSMLGLASLLPTGPVAD